MHDEVGIGAFDNGARAASLQAPKSEPAAPAEANENSPQHVEIEADLVALLPPAAWGAKPAGVFTNTEAAPDQPGSGGVSRDA